MIGAFHSTSGNDFLVTKYSNCNLAQYLEGMGTTGLSDAQIHYIISEVAKAIEHLHDKKGIFHGGLKPENVFIKYDPNGKITNVCVGGFDASCRMDESEEVCAL